MNNTSTTGNQTTKTNLLNLLGLTLEGLERKFYFDYQELHYLFFSEDSKFEVVSKEHNY